MANAYETLGVPKGASEEEIKKALQIHAANVKLKDKITKLEQALKIA